MTENVPKVLFDVSTTLNLLPDTKPCADWHVNVEIPVVESNVSEEIVIATPTLIPYCPVTMTGSPEVLATATVLLVGTSVIL